MSWHSLIAPLSGIALLFVGAYPMREPAAPPSRDGAVAAQPETPPAGQGPAAAPLAGPRAASLEEAELARRNGDFRGAVAVLRLLASLPDQATAREASLQQAVVLIEAGQGAQAVQVADALLAQELDPALRAAAWFVRGRAQRAAGDCRAAAESLVQSQRLGLGLGPYVDLQIADCARATGDAGAQLEAAERAATGATSRLARVDAIEYLVDAATRQGNREAALAYSERLLAEADTPAYRARTLTGIGTIALELGRVDAAALAFGTVVSELPETPSASYALQRLAAIDGLWLAGPDRIGRVQFHAGRFADAILALRTALEQGLPPDRAVPALYAEALALLELDRLEEAAARAHELAALAPDSDLGPRALVKVGDELERNGRLVQACEAYQFAAERFPSTDAGQEAHARLVTALVRRGAYPEAVEYARRLAASAADPRWKGLALFWSGKAFAFAGDAAQAESAWREAAAIDPDHLGGLRARAVLEGEVSPTHQRRPFDASVLRPSEAERSELAAWIERHGIDADTSRQQIASDPRVGLAAQLQRLGLREQAGWELREAASVWSADPAALYWLAQTAFDQGNVPLAMRLAARARDVAGEPLGSLPRLLQRLIYPFPYADLIVGSAEQRDVDPLLYAALVRQESGFDPTARSVANAIGLTQVIPSTGAGIARQLGRDDFRAEDLYRPIVSLEFGTYYLASQLRQNGERIFPALAAYNAGGGNANRWLAAPEARDADLFVAQIPFAETNRYVQIVYENYLLYRRIYQQ